VITGTPKDPTLGKQPDMPIPPELNYDLWLGPAPEQPYTVKRVHPRHEDKGRPGWLCIRDYADGMIANWGAHLNDIALWGMGANHTGPVEIEARGTFPPRGNLWDVVLEFEANFRFASGLSLTCKTDKPYVRFEGTEGWIHIKYPISIELSNDDLLLWKPTGNDIVLPVMDNEKRHFLDAVKSRKQPMYDAEAGHRNASLSHLALASMELDRKIDWDPVRETAPNDTEANRKLAPKPLRAPWTL
jgi:myo-inositol 2-dehydrogenase / D-chiro-inositol 1-dehydrogenase